MSPFQTPIFDPTAIPQVALASMNATHREEVELINRFGDLLARAVGGEGDVQAIGELFEQWLAHTRAHFERENALMQAHGFFAYAMHSGEHAQVLAAIEALYVQWQTDHDAAPVAAYLFEQWPSWFTQHVNTMDTVTAQFLAPLLSE